MVMWATPISLTITADAKSKNYGDADPTLTYTSEGLVNGDAITGVLLREEGEDIGTYAIHQNTVTAGNNYIITFIGDNLTINKRNLTITADSDTKVYDGTALTKDSYTNTELAAGDQIESVTVTGSQTDAGSSDNVPSAAVIKKGETDVIANYNITYANGTLEVTKKTLTITADAKSKAYGEDDPELTYTSEGLINDDAITVALTRDTGEDAGDYAINLGSLTASNNYAILYTGANLTISKVGLTVTANDNTITYGKAPAGNGVTYEGFVKNETESVLGGSLDYEYSYSQYGDVGDYTITPNGLTATNYVISYNDGSLTVIPKEIGVNWTNTEFPYNGEEHAPTATATGLENGDEIGVTVTGAQTNAGDYTATASALTGNKKDNYSLAEGITKPFTITPKSIGDDTNPAQNITIEITEANADHVVVMHGSKLLREGTNDDYSISAEGDATTKYYKVTITGRNNYEGSFNATFANLKLSKREGSSAAGGAATFVSNSGDGDFVVPDNMAAFIVTGINASAGTIVVEPLDNIPENVPVLLLSTVDANGFVVTPKNDGTGPTGTNLLQEATSAKDVSTAEIYLLYKGEFVLNAAGTLPAGKVYLPNGGTPAPAILSIDWDNVTGIETVHGEGLTVNDQSDRWYTFDGRQLQGKPTTKGLYINNGNKVVIK